MNKIRQVNLSDIPALQELYQHTVLTVNRKDYTAEEVADWASCGDDTSHWNELFEEQHYVLSLIHIYPDIIVPEIEAIRTERLYDFEKEGIQVVPSARAVNFTMNRKAIRDLAAQELGLKTAKYFYAKTLEELKEAADQIGLPCVVKPLLRCV